MNGRIIAFAIVMVLLATPLALIAVDGETDEGVSAKDDLDRTVRFADEAEYIVTLGYAFTKTMIEIGCKDKIVLIDTDSWEKIPEARSIRSVSTGSYIDVANVLDEILENDPVKKDKTLIVTYGYASSFKEGGKVSDLIAAGYSGEHIYGAYPKSYVKVVAMVNNLAILSGGSSECAESMYATYNDITSRSKSLDKTHGVYISGSSKTLKINTTGLSADMMINSGGYDVGTEYKSEDIGAFITEQAKKGNLKIVLLDGNYNGSAKDFADELKLTCDVTIYKLDKDWNTYVPEVEDGFKFISKCMHPEVFGEAEGGYNPSKSSEDNTMILALAASIMIIVVILAILSLIFYKRKGTERKFWTTKRKGVAIPVVLLVAILVAMVFSVSLVSSKISPWDAFLAIFGQSSPVNNELVWKYGMPRVTMAIFVGAGLAISGAVMQALFRNPMASPYILGLSSGASVGAALGMLFTIPLIPALFVMPVMAFIFCFGTMILVYKISSVGGKTPTETLLLSGIAVTALLTAVVSLLTYLAKDRMADIVYWTMGSLSMSGWEKPLIAVVLILAGSIPMLAYSRELNVLMIGDSHATDLGVDVAKVRLRLLLLSCLSTAACVSFVGVIGFVGLIIPHIVRIIIGPDNRRLLPYSMVVGALFLVICDFVCRIILPGDILPVGIITSLIGAPYFILLLRRRKKEVGWN